MDFGYELVKDLFKFLYRKTEEGHKIITDKKKSSLSKKELMFSNNSKLRELLNNYYYGELPIGYSRFNPEVNGQRLLTLIVENETFLNSSKQLNLQNSYFHYLQESSSLTNFNEYEKNLKNEYKKYLKNSNRNIWNGKTYRLIEIVLNNNPEFKFSMVGYEDYLYSRGGLLTFEAKRALQKSRGNVNKVLIEKDSLLKIRNITLPSYQNITDLNSRICIGGPGVLVAMARGDRNNDYCILLQRRSSQVIDGNNLYAVIPKAVHAPTTTTDFTSLVEVNITRTVLREFFEELISEKQIEENPTRSVFDWYMSNPMMQLFENPKNYKLEITGFGFNMLTGNYEFAILLQILDENFYKEFRKLIHERWEFEEIIPVYTRNKQDIERIILENDWVDEALFHFLKSLKRLKELSPDRVCLPDIEL